MSLSRHFFLHVSQVFCGSSISQIRGFFKPFHGLAIVLLQAESVVIYVPDIVHGIGASAVRGLQELIKDLAIILSEQYAEFQSRGRI